jgi:hypothetical protein
VQNKKIPVWIIQEESAVFSAKKVWIVNKTDLQLAENKIEK